MKQTYYSPNGTKLYGRSNMYVLSPTITWKCNASCDNCSSLCGSGQAPSNEDMTIENIQKLIDESIELKYPWQKWAVSGGEPACHPKCEEIILMMEEYRKKHNPKILLTIVTNGYSQKSKDMNVFALKHNFEIENSNKSEAIIKKTTKIPYIPFNISPKDVKYNVTMISCDQGERCGLSLTNQGYWECTPAAAAWRVFNDYKPICIDLKDLTEELVYKNMEHDCLNCGFALYQAPRVYDQTTSKTWRIAFENYKNKKLNGE